MEFINKAIEFIMGPYGAFAVTILIAVISELMALIPSWQANGIIDFIIKALKKLKEKQDEKKSQTPPAPPAV